MDAIAPEVQHRFRKVGREHAFEALREGATCVSIQRLSPYAFALSGRTLSPHSTQGDALGYVLVAPSGRA